MIQSSMLVPSRWNYLERHWFRISRVFGTLVISKLLTAFPLHHTHSELIETLTKSVLYNCKLILICRSLVGMKELMFVAPNLHTSLLSVRFDVLTAETITSIVFLDVISYNLRGRLQNLLPPSSVYNRGSTFWPLYIIIQHQIAKICVS
jgi:hypothetical protein